MYKRTSRSLQNAHKVNRQTLNEHGAIDPDYIPSAANMSRQQCERELAQLSIELARFTNELPAAKAARNAKRIAELGVQIQTICARRTPIKRRLHDLRQLDHGQALGEAVRSVVTDADLQRAIFAEAKRIAETPPLPQSPN